MNREATPDVESAAEINLNKLVAVIQADPTAITRMNPAEQVALAQHFNSLTQSHDALNKQNALLAQERGVVRDEVATAMMVGAENAALMNENTRISKLALSDALTGLPNRRAFEEAGSHLFEADERAKKPTSLLFIDLDKFKLLNDTLGHAAGDETLVKVAEILSWHARGADAVARLGGDEFVVLLSGASQADAVIKAQKILDDIQAYANSHADLQKIGLGASIGVVGSDQLANRPHGLHAFMGIGDATMYHVKESGRGRVGFYGEAPSQQAVAA